MESNAEKSSYPNGLIFGRKALLWTAGIIIAIGSIMGGIIGFIRFVK